MRRYAIRALMAAVGVVALVAYAAAAWIGFLFLQSLWRDPPSALSVVLVLVVATLVLGYLSYRFGTDRLLASLPTRELTPGSAPSLFERVDALCRGLGIDRPQVYVADMGEPNAFAVSGPNGGAVVVDRSLSRVLTDAELEGILAHELAHLESHDSLIQTFAFTGLQTAMSLVVLLLVPVLLLFTGVAKADAWMRGRPGAWTRTFAWRLRTAVVSLVMVVPAVAVFVLLARSRRREFAADRRAAEVTGDPIALARALRKVDAAAQVEMRLRGFWPHPDGDENPLVRLLATHPATEKRVERLVEMAEG